jgi:NitT/TauT family transport system substrate-binding protein
MEPATRSLSARLASLGLVVSLIALAGCSKSAGEQRLPVSLRLGYFPNLTHAPAIYGVEKGIYKAALGSDVKLETKTFNAGPDVVTALFSGDLDISYVGPNPAVNGFQRSKGEALRVIAGSTSGGAALVTKPTITSPPRIKGKKIATPQLGNTQDVALRAWLADRGLNANQQGGGDVSIVNQENSQTLDTFKAGQIDGAWVPEPWATRLVLEGGGKILVDEATLWPKGRYTTTLLVVRTEFLRDHRDLVERFLRGHIQTLDRLADDPEAQKVVNAGLEKLTDKPLSEQVLAQAWDRLDFTYDPLISTVEQSASAARNVGLLDSDEIEGISDLKPLNKILRAAGKNEVPG